MNRLTGALAVAVLLPAAGCSDPTGTRAQGSPQGAINVYLYQKPKRFSPLDPPSGPDQQVMTLIFDNLLTVDDSYGYAPRLAERWEVAADRITFHLRQGLKWSDGMPFTSKDVLFTYKLLADAGSGSAMAGKLAGAAFEAPDATTFVIRPAEPNVGFLSLIAGPYAFILPEHVLGGEPVDEIAGSTFFNHPTVGMGPYTFVRYQTDQYVELAANPHYRKPVAIPRIFLKPISSDVATAQLGTGEMDLVQISPTDLRAVEELEGGHRHGEAESGLHQGGGRPERQALRRPPGTPGHAPRDRPRGAGRQAPGRPGPGTELLVRHLLGAARHAGGLRLRPGQGPVAAGRGGLEGRRQG